MLITRAYCIVDNEGGYHVEGILDSQVFRMRLQYLVKWVGYDHDRPD